MGRHGKRKGHLGPCEDVTVLVMQVGAGIEAVFADLAHSAPDGIRVRRKSVAAANGADVHHRLVSGLERPLPECNVLGLTDVAMVRQRPSLDDNERMRVEMDGGPTVVLGESDLDVGEVPERRAQEPLVLPERLEGLLVIGQHGVGLIERTRAGGERQHQDSGARADLPHIIEQLDGIAGEGIGTFGFAGHAVPLVAGARVGAGDEGRLPPRRHDAVVLHGGAGLLALGLVGDEAA